ncbi:MAG: sugar O-acetyltransferase, partial [Alistipes sp.]|nr:sugar O-acetyltransferase [Alistipes sp.]
MNDIIERMRSGKRISETDPDFPRLCEEVEKTRRLVGELNTGYHTPDEVRALLERIWGQPLDASVRMFPPFYTAFGKTPRVGKEVFINFSC